MGWRDTLTSWISLATTPTAPAQLQETPSAAPAADVGPIPDDPRELRTSPDGFGYGGAGVLFNALSGTGTLRDPTTANQFIRQRRLRRDELTALGRNAIAARGLGLPGSTATREGWTVKINDPRVKDPIALSQTIKTYEARLGIQGKVARASFRSRQWGQAIVLLNVIDGRGWDEPVDRATIKEIKWAAVIDRRDYYVSHLAEEDSAHFATPSQYTITDINGVLEDGLRYGDDLSRLYTIGLDFKQATNKSGGMLVVHADRVLAFNTADWWPMLEGMQDAIAAYFESMNGLRRQANEGSMVIYGIKSLWSKVFGADAAKTYQRLSIVQTMKSALNAYVIDEGAESVTPLNKSGSMTGVAEPFQVWVSASYGVPVTQFWGGSPSGFNTGEYETSTYEKEIRAFQTQVLAAPTALPKLHGYIIAAANGGGLSTDIDREIEFADLSPPDEVVRGDLRTQTIDNVIKLSEKGLITRTEGRGIVAGVSDENFDFMPTAEGDAIVKQNALVGIFTGSLELVRATVPEGTPLPTESVQELLLALGPETFNTANVARIMGPINAMLRPATPTPSTPPSVALPTPTETDAPTSALGSEAEDLIVLPAAEPADAFANQPAPTPEPDEPDEVSIKFSDATPPADAMTVPELLEHPELARWRLRKLDLTLMAKREQVIAYGLPKRPLYSLAEVKAALVSPRAPATSAPAEPVDEPAADAHSPTSCCIAFVLPPDLAASVPTKSEDPSAAHITVIYMPEVSVPDRERVVQIVSECARRCEAPIVTLPGDVAYFTVNHDGEPRCVAHSTVDSPDLLSLESELYHALRAAGFALSEYSEPSRYIPHVTLAYLPADGEYDGPNPKGTWRADDLRFWFGDAEAETRVQVPHSLTNDEALAADLALVDTLADSFDEQAFMREALDANDDDNRAVNERIAEAFRKYHETVNMGAAELRKWAAGKWAGKASLSRAPIDRNLTLLETPREKWTLRHAASAMRTVSFVSRMNGMPKGQPVSVERGAPSKRDISLKNWAFDPNK